MQPPLPPGTILQNRYCLLQVLGQGGFGRTYLAEDQGRFNERCALKEFMPPQAGYALDKAKELFQREAAILYQIQHPQVPQFRATFEQDQRLFLVQDYVDGKTYRDCLEERRAQGQRFSEAEIDQLLRQLLPVLAHIHSKGIIHRDIAPDNIILREGDRLPVLIDFGVVKEAVTRMQSPETQHQATTVGKAGYAPSEQLQTGQAYPSSDLYALAVTAVVLLTGRDAGELYNDRMLTWHWQNYAPEVSPRLAQVLNRMLSHKPDDRYQSVREVVEALQSAQAAGAPPPIASPPQQYPSPIPTPTPLPTPAPTPPPPATQVSSLPTQAIGRPLEAETQVARGARRPRRGAPVIQESSFWDDPLAVTAVGTGLVLLTGFGSWAAVSFLMGQPRQTPSPTTPQVSVSPLSPSPTIPSPTSSPSPTEPVLYSKRLALQPSETLTQSDTLRANETVDYIIAGEQGQTLSAYLSGEGVLMSVLGPNQQLVGDRADRVSLWQGELPFTGNYALRLRTVQGLAESDYQLEVSLENPPPSPSPSSPTPTSPTPTSPAPTSPTPTSPSSPPEPIYSEEVLDLFGTGETLNLTGRTTPQRIQRYRIQGPPGKILDVRVASGPVSLTIRYPDGKVVEDAVGLVEWSAEVLSNGGYLVDVQAEESTDFRLEVSLAAPDSPPEP